MGGEDGGVGESQKELHGEGGKRRMLEEDATTGEEGKGGGGKETKKG